MTQLFPLQQRRPARTWLQILSSDDAQRGQSTVEWGGLSLIIVFLMLAVTTFIGNGGGGPLAAAISNEMGQLVVSLEGGGGNAGAPNQPRANAPSVNVPGVTVPDPNIPTFAVPSTATAAVATTARNVNSSLPSNSAGNSGGGFWGWVQSVGNGITNAVSGAWQSVSNWFSSLPNWAKGLLIGIAAAIVVVVGVVVLFAAGVIGTGVAIAAAIVGAVAAIGVGLWYGITHIGDAFNAWHAFAWALGGGIIGALTGGFIAAFWAPISAGLASAWGAITSGIGAFARGAVAAIGRFGTWAGGVIRGAGTAVANFARATWTRIGTALNGAATTIANFARSAWATTTGFFQAVGRVLSKPFTDAVIRQRVITNLIVYAGLNTGKIIDLGQALIEGRWSDAAAIAGQLAIGMTAIVLSYAYIAQYATVLTNTVLRNSLTKGALAAIATTLQTIVEKGFSNWELSDWAAVAISALVSGALASLDKLKLPWLTEKLGNLKFLQNIATAIGVSVKAVFDGFKRVFSDVLKDWFNSFFPESNPSQQTPTPTPTPTPTTPVSPTVPPPPPTPTVPPPTPTPSNP